MNVLLAESDRDFLVLFKKLFEYSGHKTNTVFDGTQVLKKIMEEKYDVVVLEQNIPRVRTGEILRVLNEEKIPVIVLLENNLNSEMLSDNMLANNYMSFPFYPAELMEAVEMAGNKKRRVEKEITIGESLVVDLEENYLCGKIRLTDGEIRVFHMMSTGKWNRFKDIDVYISSINSKLKKLERNERIRYIMNEGYRLVRNDG